MTRCTKTRYRDRIAALLVLAQIKNHDKASRPKQEARAYYCDECHAWHLTSRRYWRR
ncbi:MULTISPECIES: hypothetical protein [unclassified Microbacterium]|uniref:hypothetical protein n=1 Tax=unclassified Microbacterium TaxID=2609290 RepID=UPI003650322C